VALEILDARPSDAPGIATIYDWYVAHTPATFDLEPMPLDDRLAWLAEHRDPRHRALVAVERGEVVGFVTSSRFRPRAAYDTTVETSVYVHHQHVGRGIGGALYSALFEALDGLDLHRACAGITMPNPASEALHRSFGFRPVGRFTEQGWKFGRYWDVAWFERGMGDGRP
jgi:phosphinothricin acetyltransferase